MGRNDFIQKKIEFTDERIQSVQEKIKSGGDNTDLMRAKTTWFRR
jgi:hypothetical protein